jgi:large subunit ribosomal protein L15
MKIHELDLTAARDRKRVGRGISAGQGKTAGRGTKGQKARTGGMIRIGFEGGQNPLAKRLPKLRGFKAINHVTNQPINVSALQGFKAGSTVDPTLLHANGLIASMTGRVKLLATGEIKHKLTVRVHAASAAATAKIVASGGTVELIDPKHKK